MLKLNNLSFNYGLKKILKNLTLEVKKGETVALIGSSGSGKTTLLKLIGGLLKPEEGEITAPKDSAAYMTQQDLLLPWRTVEQNIRLACELEKRALPPFELDELLEKLEITSLRDQFPHQLSGGQYKRAMLARTLAPKKEILLLDEPFSALDLPLRDKLYERLRSLSQATTLLVTHDFRDAYHLADRILLLQEGEIGQEWILDPLRKEDPSYLGTLFNELRVALSRPASS